MNIWSKIIYSDEQPRGWLPWGVIAPVIAFTIFVSALVGSGTVLKVLGFVDHAHNHIGPTGLIAMLITSFGLAGVLIILWIKFIEKRSLSSIGLAPNNGSQIFLRGHVIGIAMMAAIIFSVWLLGGYDVGSIAPAFASSTSLLYIFLLLIGFGIQSSVEEFIFRGWLLSVLTRKFNLITAIIVSSALFVLMHFDPASPWYNNIILALFALFACAWVIRTGNIWGVMGWHAGWNWFTAVGFELPITGLDTGTPALIAELKPIGNRLLHGGDTGPEGSLVCMAVLALGSVYLFWQKSKTSST